MIKPFHDASIEAFINKSTIIIKMIGNGSSPLKSRSERFLNFETETPGPGTYDNQNTNKKKAFYPHNFYIEEFRQANNLKKVPSIPLLKRTDKRIF